jgi:predicted double-glycine peptidase
MAIRAIVVALWLGAVYGESLDVPFVRQRKQGCGPASVAMVIRYWENQGARFAEGADVPDVIYKALYRRELHGSSSTDMIAYLHEYGFAAFAVDGSPDDLDANLARGRPLIVSVQPSPKAPLHYVVVVGREGAKVILNDPAQHAAVVMPENAFEKEWRRTGNWLLIAAPQNIPQQVPKQVPKQVP